jgi:hypothetical protein
MNSKYLDSVSGFLLFIEDDMPDEVLRRCLGMESRVPEVGDLRRKLSPSKLSGREELIESLSKDLLSVDYLNSFYVELSLGELSVISIACFCIRSM